MATEGRARSQDDGQLATTLPGGASMVEEPRVVIDHLQLESLRELNEPGGGDVVTELIDIFLEQSPLTLLSLKAEVAQTVKDARKIEKLAHKLKGSCANLGAEYLRALCQSMEEKGRERNVTDLQPLMTLIEQAFIEVCEVLKREWRIPAA